MVMLQKRSVGALKPKRSSFDSWVGRSASFDTSTMLANRPIPAPAVVEDVVPGMSVPDKGTQNHRPRQIRFLGLTLKLPFLGSKDKRGQGKSDGWRHCQTTSDSSGDERSLLRRRTKALAQISGQQSSQLGERSPKGCFENESRPLGTQSLKNPQLLPLDSDLSPDRSQSYLRSTQSLDFGVTDQPTMPWQLFRQSTLERVEENCSPANANFMEPKIKWTQRASRRVVSMATRFSRKSKDRQSAPQKPDLERNSASLLGNRKSKRRSELERRKSMGSFMGGRPDAYDTPGPEGPRCPPDNVYIPSGPPDAIYVQAGNTDRQMSLDSPGPYLATPIAAAYPSPCSNSAMSYRSRWSTDSGLVHPVQWAHLGNDAGAHNSSMEAECEEYYGQWSPEARASMQAERLFRRWQSSEAADQCTSDQSAVSKRRGLDDSSIDIGARLPVRSPGTMPVRVQSAGWACDSQDGIEDQDTECISDGGLNGHRPMKNTKPGLIPKDRSHGCAQQWESGGVAGSYPRLLSFDSRRSFRTLTPGPRSSFEAEAMEEPMVHKDGGDVSHRHEEEGIDSCQDSFIFDSLEFFKGQHSDRGIDDAESVSHEGCDLDADCGQDGRCCQRASLSLSEPQNKHLANKTQAQVNLSAWAQQPANRIDLCASCTSDGPLYHRSVFFENGFSSGDESDDDLDGCERFTPTQFILKLKPTQHHCWHSDFFDGSTALHFDDLEGYQSPSRYRLDRGDQIDDMISDYSEGFYDYPDEPGFSLRTGSDSDFVLPEFDDIEGRSCDRQRRSLEGHEKPRKTWLDELQECAELRRKECTYRIACQRAIMQSMKETVQASKLAFERLKSGLCPQATSKVPELRRRWGGRQRAKRREKIVNMAKRKEEELWEDIPLATSACGLLHLCS